MEKRGEWNWGRKGREREKGEREERGRKMYYKILLLWVLTRFLYKKKVTNQSLLSISLLLSFSPLSSPLSSLLSPSLPAFLPLFIHLFTHTEKDKFLVILGLPGPEPKNLLTTIRRFVVGGVSGANNNQFVSEGEQERERARERARERESKRERESARERAREREQERERVRERE
jgi:hypothetical protein